MFARSLAFVVWAGTAASAVAWGYKLFTPAQPVPPHAALATRSAAQGADLTRLFGAQPVAAQPEAAPPPPESSRFQLIGVAAPRVGAAPNEGVALIALDGKSPRAYRVGAVIDGEQLLLAVHARGAAVGPRNGSATINLELPALPPASTGVPVAAAPMAQPMPMPAPAAMVPPGMPPAALQAAQAAQMAGPGLAAQARLRALRNAGGAPEATMPAPPQLAQPPVSVVPMPEQITNDSRNLR